MEGLRLRQIHVLILASFYLGGCSPAGLFPSTAAPAVLVPTLGPAPSASPLPSATSALNQATPSFTPTPTFLNQTPSATPTSTLIASPSSTGQVAAETPILATTGVLFTEVRLSTSQVFWGACTPASTVVTVQVDQSAEVEKVLMALRLENPRTSDTTPWGGYAIMQDKHGGRFTYRLTAKSFSRYRDYISAWGQFQLIAIGRNEQIVGRSKTFQRMLAVAPCP